MSQNPPETPGQSGGSADGGPTDPAAYPSSAGSANPAPTGGESGTGSGGSTAYPGGGEPSYPGSAGSANPYSPPPGAGYGQPPGGYGEAPYGQPTPPPYGQPTPPPYGQQPPPYGSNLRPTDSSLRRRDTPIPMPPTNRSTAKGATPILPSRAATRRSSTASRATRSSRTDRAQRPASCRRPRAMRRPAGPVPGGQRCRRTGPRRPHRETNRGTADVRSPVGKETAGRVCRCDSSVARLQELQDVRPGLPWTTSRWTSTRASSPS